MATLGQYYVQVIPSAEGITGKLKSIFDQEAAGAGESAGTTIGQQIGSFATKAIAALGVGKMISDSITNGMDFESSMAKANTLFSGTGDQFRALQDEIMGLSSTYGVAASEFAEAAYSAESASVPMENIGGILEGSAKLAVAGYTDIDTALSATAKTMNAYGMVTDDVAETQAAMDKVQRVLIQTQNKGITTVGELGASLAQVTPTAAAFGVSFEQVGASLAGMTAQGTPTAQATTQLNSLIAELGKNGTNAANNLLKAAKGTEYAGMSFSEMMDAGLTLNDVLDMMQGLADENNLAMVDLFSSIEAGKAAMSINNSDFIGSLEAMATEADVVGEAFGTMAETAGFKLDQLKTSLTNIGIEAFSASADTLVGIMDGVKSVLDGVMPSLRDLGGAFMEMGEKVVDVIGGMLGIDESFSTTETVTEILKTAIEGITDAIGFLTENMEVILPVVALLAAGFETMKIVSTISSAFTTLSGVFSAVSAAMSTTLIPALSATAASVWAVLAPILPIIAAIGLVVAAGVLWVKNWDDIKMAAQVFCEEVAYHFENFKESVIEVWENVKTAVSEKWEAIKTTVTDTVENIKTAISEKFEAARAAVASAVEAVLSKITEIFNNIVNTVRTTVENVRSTIQQKFNEAKILIKNAVEEALRQVKEKFQNMLSTVTEKATSIMNTARDKFNEMKNKIKEAVENALKEVKEKFQQIWEAIKSKCEEIVNTARDKFNEMKNKVLEAIGNLITALPAKLAEIKSAFTEKFGEMAKDALNWGGDIVKGIADGISNAIGKVRDAASNVASTIRGFLHFSEPDIGPLSDFHTYMPDMIDLMVKGIHDGLPLIRSAVDALALEVRPELTGSFARNIAPRVARREETGFTQNLTVNAPTELSPSEVARQTRIATQNVALAWRMA